MIKRIGQGNRNMHEVKEGTSRLNLGARLMATVLLLSVCLMAGATPPPPNPHIPLNAEVTVSYYHNDLLGSPVAATDEQGELIWREDYKPFGEKLENDPAASNDRLWYTGKSHDEDTGLTYFGARYYDPIVGRFMATDPVGFSESNPMLFNRYAYANNNPYRFVDPDGNFPAAAAIPWVIEGAKWSFVIITGIIGGQALEEEVLTPAYRGYMNENQGEGSEDAKPSDGVSVGVASGDPNGDDPNNNDKDVQRDPEKALEKELGRKPTKKELQNFKQKHGFSEKENAVRRSRAQTRNSGGSEHTSGARNSTEGKHQRGQARKAREQSRKRRR